MSFPTAGTPVSTQFASTVYSMSVTMPASVSSGDLLLAFVETRYTYPPGPWTAPTGWTNLFNKVGGGSVGTLSAFYKKANGTEGGTTPTWTWQGGSATTAAWQVYDVTGWDGTTTPYSSTSSGDAVTPSSPALTPSGGSNSYLWMAVVGDAATGSPFTSAPSGYSGFTNTEASSGGADTEVATAYLQATASSETPGSWGFGSNRFWASATLAITPAASAAGPIGKDIGPLNNNFGAMLNQSVNRAGTY